MQSVLHKETLIKIEQEFTRLKDECYLDHAGASLYSEKQIQNIFKDLTSSVYGNPHSLSMKSKDTTDVVDQVRHRILKHFHTSSEEYSIIFTSGATGAIKLLLDNFDFLGQSNDESDPDEEEFYDVICNHVGPCRNEKRKYCYAFTQSNHTSVVGGRGTAEERGVPWFCLPDDDATALLQQNQSTSRCRNSGNSLFAYPAQCNFSGRKFPLGWITETHKGKLNTLFQSRGHIRPSGHSTWFTLLDAATFCSTNDLNLGKFKPDFVCVSFYKIFGYPTGLGALLVHNQSAYVLNKKYFGGGTVDISIPSRQFHKFRKVFHERFEDGTIPFLSIIALNHGISTLERLNLSMPLISEHVFQLALYTIKQLQVLKHWNGEQVAELYLNTKHIEPSTQGGIVNFNLKRSDGRYIGFIEVLHIANLYNITFRTGCFCNSGACQKYLRLSEQDLLEHFHEGHICGDARDLINGRPTGSIRVSFGYMSRSSDVDKLIHMIRQSFVESKDTNVSLQRKHSEKGTSINLKKILMYPIKSCGAMEVSEWQLNERGLEYDREWMIVTKEGICLTQKQEPRLCLILPFINLAQKTLTLQFRNSAETITIPIENHSESLAEINLCDNKVCGDRIKSVDCGSEVAKWLESQLERPGLRLVRQIKNDERKSKVAQLRNKNYEENAKLSLANQAQYLLINQGSVDWLTHQIDDEDISTDDFADRFRSNFIIEGTAALSEADWTEVSFGNLIFRVEGSCTRCQMICINQKTGEKNRKPIVELSKAMNGKLKFGIYLTLISKPGIVRQKEVVSFK